MKQLLVSLFSVLTLTACSQSGVLGPVVSPQVVFAGKNIHLFGNSITHGNGGTGTRYATQLAALQGSTEMNYGISGQVMEQIDWEGRTQFNMNTIPVKTADDAMLYIALGVNDIAATTFEPSLGFSVSGYKTQYLAVIDHAFSKGWTGSTITVLTPFRWVWDGTLATQEAYRQAVIQVAQEKHLILADIQAHQFALGSDAVFYTGTADGYSQDGLHPNQKGNTDIATFLFTLNYSPQ